MNAISPITYKRIPPAGLSGEGFTWHRASEPNHVTHYPFAVTGIRGDVEDFAAKAIQQHAKWEGHKKGLPVLNHVTVIAAPIVEARAHDVAAYVTKHPGAFAPEIARSLGVHENSARAAVTQAVALGLVRRVPRSVNSRYYGVYPIQVEGTNSEVH